VSHNLPERVKVKSVSLRAPRISPVRVKLRGAGARPARHLPSGGLTGTGAGHRRPMTRLLEHREQLREERRERPRTAPATAARLVARPTTAGFRDCRGVWHPWDEVA